MDQYMETSLDMPLREVLVKIQKRIMERTSYFGVKTLKNPLDFWVYSEIIFHHKPDVVVEIGNNWGGSTLAFAHLLDSLGKGRIIGIDINHEKVPDAVKNHGRITLIEQDAVSAFEAVGKRIQPEEKVLVIEDSAHTYENTLSVLKLYSKFIHPGDYFIVEDSICHHGLDVGPSPGPYEAICDFVKQNPLFEIDREKESFLITWNPKGFLKRVG